MENQDLKSLTQNPPSTQTPTVPEPPTLTPAYTPGSLPNTLRKDSPSPNQNSKELEVSIRTLKSDIEELTAKGLKEPKPQGLPPASPPIPGKIAAESQFQAKIETPAAPLLKPAPLPPPPTQTKPILPLKSETPKPPTSPKLQRGESTPPVLIIPPKKPFLEIPQSLPKAFPAWLKIGSIALVVSFLTFFSLYAYWKIFIQIQTPQGASSQTPAQSPSTTTPALPVSPEMPKAMPVKFFNQLPSKSVTLDLASKDPQTLKRNLENEAARPEIRASIKQILITYQNKALDLKDFFNLLGIFTPKDFLSNYQDEFAFVSFSQKEGARAGLILKTKNPDLAETQMQNWQNSTFPSDVLPLFLNLKSIPTPGLFKEYTYAGQIVRFLNTNSKSASLNYAIYNGDLIITTSSATMFVILQDLTGLNISQ